MKADTMAKNSSPAAGSSRPTMGNVAAPVNASGAPSANMTTVPKRSNGSGMLEAATAVSRTQIYEVLGAPTGITAGRFNPVNSPEASLVQRNVTILPPAKGRSQFWDARGAAQA